MSVCFVSHSTEECPVLAEAITDDLKDVLDIEIWYAQERISVAEDFKTSIQQTLKKADWFLLAMTPQSAGSDWVKFELETAFDLLPARRIIPVMIEPCDPGEFHPRLRDIQNVKLFKNQRRALREVVRQITIVPKLEPLAGRWTGYALQEFNEETGVVKYRATIDFGVEEQRLTGLMKVHPDEIHDEDEDIEYSLSGHLMRERFLQLEYHARDPGRFNFGSIILEKDFRSRKLDGRFVCLSATADGLSGGEVHLTREKTADST